MNQLSPAVLAQRTLSSLAAKGLPPTAPNFLAQFREISGDDSLSSSAQGGLASTDEVLKMMALLMDAVKQASTNLQQDLSAFGHQSKEMIAEMALHTDPVAANEMFHALSASASWLLGEVSATQRELSNTRFQLSSVRAELSRAQDLAVTDALTGLPNRRGLEFALTHELARARRNRLPLSVALFDLDHFKQMNDQHGHAAGDTILRHVCALIRQKLRTTDIFTRYGGDEFVAVLPETENHGAEIVVSRLLETLKRTPAIWDEQLIAVSASVGVTQWLPGESVQAMLERADQAMYSAKRQGRGRVVCAEIPALPIAPSTGD